MSGVDGISVATFIPGAITFVLGGGLATLLAVWVNHRNNSRSNDRADRSEDRADQKGVAELAQLMQEMAQSALRQAQADLERARQELREARQQMAHQEVEHGRIVGRLSRRIQQLVEVITGAGLDVPDELPDEQ